jgi:phage-related minor tail protein
MANLTLDVVAMDKFSQNLNKMGDQLEKLARRLEGLDRVTVKPEVDLDTRKAERKFDSFATGVGTAAGLVGAKMGAALMGGLLGSMDAGKANDKLAAQLGASPKMAAELGKVAGSLYSQAYGDSLDGVNEAIRGVMQSGLVMEDDSTEVLQGITAQVLDLSTAYGTDLAGTTQAVGQLMKSGLAPNAQVALDVVTRGFQEGADRSGDFLDTLTEYSVQFEKFGLDATMATGLLVQGMKAGARNSDLVADAIKEFSIRAINGSDLTVQGFKAVGLNASKMAKEIAKGGPTAEKALDLTLDKLRAMPDPIKRSQAAVALFGTQAEDLGAALFALDPSAATDRLGKLEGASKDLGKTLNDNAATNIESFKRQITTTFTDVLGGKVLPKVNEFATMLATKFGPTLQKVTGWVKQNQEWLKPLASVLGVLVGIILVIAAATKAWAVVQTILNAALFANPIGLVVLAVAALAAGVIYAYTHSETFRRIVTAAWESIQAAVGWAWNNVIKPAWDAFSWYLSNVLGPVVMWLWNTIIKPTFSALGGHIKWTWENIIAPAFNAIKGGVEAVGNGFSTAVNAIGRVWDGIKEKTRAPINFVIDTVFNNGITKAWNTLAGFVGLPKLPMLPLIGAGGGGTAGGGALRFMAAGGAVPGVGNKDTVPAMLMPGEFVLSKLAVTQLGGLRTVDALHQGARKGRTTAEILYGGDPSEPGLAYFADGGAVLKGLAYARAQVGKPYLWGGTGPTGFDCSGLMSALVGVLTGGNPQSRRFSTASFAQGRGAGGFQPGLNSAFGIGVVRGNPGHMAGTLGGINIEATPPRIRMGADARGARHPSFTMQFSLPQVGGEFIGGSGGSLLDLVRPAFKSVFSSIDQLGGSPFASGIAALTRKMVEGTVTGLVARMPGFASGGIVPGPRGVPVPIVAHGGEAVIPAGGALRVELAPASGAESLFVRWMRTFVKDVGGGSVQKTFGS